MNITFNQISKLSAGSFIYVDIRDEISYQHGHIDGAIRLEQLSHFVKKEEEIKLIVYCTYGEKSHDIADSLRKQGYDAYSLEGGFREWLLNHSGELSQDELIRYDRQIILPQLGIDGQIRLKHSKVLIVGVGGLGAPAAMYLAGAGIGEIGLIDADVVSISNLQRQIIYDMQGENINKAVYAKEKLEHLNSNIKVEAYSEFLLPDNAENIISKYDFVIDASDNFQTKFLINDVCVLQAKAFCHAGILGFQGQVITYVPGKGPCYRCIFEDIPKDKEIPNCSTAGIIGAMAGVIGSIQALEAIKYIVGIGKLLTGRMYVFDGLTMTGRIVEIPNKNKQCKVCGSDPVIRNIFDNKQLYNLKSCEL